jgi:hypothetical protein
MIPRIVVVAILGAAKGEIASIFHISNLLYMEI